MKRLTKFATTSLLLTIVSPLFPMIVGSGSAGFKCSIENTVLGTNSKPAHVVFHCIEDDTTFVITGYDRDGDLREGVLQQPDFEDDVWTFDALQDGTINLAIDFHRDETGLVADLFDDQTGDNHVDVVFRRGQVHISESDFPTVRLSAPDGWWESEDMINFNLGILVDGQIEASYGIQLFPQFYDVLATDGNPDFQLEIYDDDGDGRPDYELQHWLKNSQPIRSHLMYNPLDNEAPIEDSFFWPYLGTESVGLLRRYNSNPPPIRIAWNASKITSIGEMVASRAHDNNCFIYTLAPIYKGDVNYTNFENPFCFYDLADDQDGYPEMAIRTEYWGPRDIQLLFGTFPLPLEFIRYSWDQDNSWPPAWDYKLGLAGLHPIDEIWEFRDFAVKTIPYDQYPTWVAEHAWDIVTFVAREGVIPWNGEGITAWGVPRPIWEQYLTGRDDERDTTNLQSIGIGLRGEYDLEREGTVRLYMSAIDRKLHLFGAQKGFWQIDESHKIEYNDLNGDDFVDSWTYYDGDEAIQTLFSTERFLIHFGPGTTRIVAAEVPQALFEARPPTTHADWLLLNEQLARHQHVFPAGDLLPMLNQFDGPALTVSEATGKDFRFTEEGFRFVIEPKSQMRLVVDGGIELPGFTDLARPYVIEYVDGSLSAEALTQPALRLDANMLNTVPPQMEEMVIGQVRVLVYNAGLADAHDVVIEAVFSQAAHTELITTTLSLAPGQGYAEAEFDWAPPKAGAWDMAISFDSEGSGGEQALASSVRIQVLPADRVSPLDLIRLDAAEETGWAIAGLFFSIVAAAGATGVLIWRGLVRQ